MTREPARPASAGPRADPVGPGATEPAAGTRTAALDNLKVALVAGVVVAHATMAWADLDGAWVFSEPPVREPLLSVLDLLTIVAAAFGMPLFFLLAGLFTPASLRRKGFWRFAGDRTVRLLVPSLAYVLLLSPPIEYVDPDSDGWTRGFWPFVPHVWTEVPPPPGPTWFLGVLLVFSLGYAVARRVNPLHDRGRTPLRGRHLALAALVAGAGSFLVRLVAPLGHEVWHLAVAQAPSWVVGFVVGVLAGERGWFRPLEPRTARSAGRAAAACVTLCVVLVGAAVPTWGLDVLLGGGTWQSLALAMVEGAVMVTVSVWLVDLFQRRVRTAGPLARGLSRAAFAAFLVHQGVLVVLVMASRQVALPPEVEYAGAAALGVALSFAAGAVIVRIPGVSRVV